MNMEQQERQDERNKLVYIRCAGTESGCPFSGHIRTLAGVDYHMETVEASHQ